MDNPGTKEQINWAVKFTKGNINIAVNNSEQIKTIDGIEFVGGGLEVGDTLRRNGQRTINIKIDGNWTNEIIEATRTLESETILYEIKASGEFIKNISRTANILMEADFMVLNLELNRIFNGSWNWERTFDEREFPGISGVR